MLPLASELGGRQPQVTDSCLDAKVAKDSLAGGKERQLRPEPASFDSPGPSEEKPGFSTLDHCPLSSSLGHFIHLSPKRIT